MKRQLDFDQDMHAVAKWLQSESHSASGEMKEKLMTLWWAYQEARDRSAVLTDVLVAASAKSLDLKTQPTGDGRAE